MKPFNGCRVFSATMREQRDVLGDKVTDWMAANPTFDISDIIVTQSSDREFHCIAITVFYLDPVAASRTIPPSTKRIAMSRTEKTP